jgi:uncharacterized protein (DUF3820 family)/uncharacterized protein YlaI
MYTDETVLDYGKYKGKMLKDIPKDYFVNVYISGGDEHAKLKMYIEANLQKFPGLTTIAWFNKKQDVMVEFKCNKRTYPTKKSAMDSIVIPKTKSNRPVPIRAYECPECSGWHLTSKEYERVKK